MTGKYYKAFGKEEKEEQELPHEVVELLNKKLPDNFKYMKNGEGRYEAVPDPEKISKGITLRTEYAFDEEKDAPLLARLKMIPRSQWEEYFYRLQRAIPIKNPMMGDENKLVPLEMLSGDPLSDEKTVLVDAMIYPSGFPDPIKMVFETPEGERVEIGIQQQAYDSLSEIKYGNVDFSAMKIVIYQYSPLTENSEEQAHTNKNKQLVISYTATPVEADTVRDAVVALHIMRGLYHGMTRINGKAIQENNSSKIDPERLENSVKLWETALRLEEELEVRFDPGANFPGEDVRFFDELRNCLLEKKAIIWRHPFDHFHISNFTPASEELDLEKHLGSGDTQYMFLEGPIPATLLGAQFDLYYRTEMKDLVVTNIAWDDEKMSGAEVYIADAPGKQWTLSRMYMTGKEAQTFSARMRGSESFDRE